MPNPLVSVCIPNYNNAEFLEQAIRSALNQTVSDLEVIVCDNQSTDNSLEVARAIDDPRLSIHLNERNLGIYGNFARTAEGARGKYLKFLCADDWLEPRYLEATLNEFARNPDVALVTTRQAVYRDNQIMQYRLEPVENQEVYTTEQLLNASLRRPNPLGNPTRVIVRRDVFDEVGGFDITNEFSGELDLWLRMAVKHRVAAVPEVLSCERIHPAQTTNLFRRQAKDIRDICRAFKKNIDQLPEYWSLERRVSFCRHALQPYVRQAMRAYLKGETEYWKVLDQNISELCPRQYWLPYHLIVSPVSLAMLQIWRKVRTVARYAKA